MTASNGSANGSVHNTGDPNRRIPTEADRMERMVANFASMRDQFFGQFLNNGPRDINRECMYPETGQLYDPRYYRELYEREPIATRVVQLMPKESWQASPLVYEDEDPDTATEFERAWDELGQSLRGENCYYQDEDGSPIWEHLQRADQLSGIGHFGVILIGVDDGRNLDQPADGVVLANPTTNRLYPSRVSEEITVNRDGQPFEDKRGPSPLMVPVVNSRGRASFVDQDVARAAVSGRWEDGTPCVNRLVVNAPSADRGFGPRQGRHEPDFGRATRVDGSPLYSDPASFAGAVGTDAQYVGVQLAPPARSSETPKDRRRLMFLRCFDEALVQVVQYEADMRNPRFGLPVMYRITLNDPSVMGQGIGLQMATVRVHWSRVIHLADNLDSSEVSGVPRMRPVLNPILDVRKVRGAGAEGYWKSCFAGLALETHPQLGGDVSVNEDNTKRMLQDYFMDFNRGLVLMGMSAKTLAPSVVDPTPHINVLIEAICIQLGCPIRIFKGSERGELASSQDDSSWNDRVKLRQKNHCTPRVIIPFIDRMISLGVLPEPRGGAMQEKDDRARDVQAQSERDILAMLGPPAAPVGQPPPGQPSGAPPFSMNRRGGWRHRTRIKAYRVHNKVYGNTVTYNAEFFEEKKDTNPEALGLDNPDNEVVGVETEESDVYDSPAGYSIEWPDINSTSHSDKASIALQETQALASYVSGNLEAIIPPEHFYTDVMQWPEERARQIIEDARAHQAETMTMPPEGMDGHPATEPEPDPLMLPYGSELDGADPQGGVVYGPKPAKGEPAQHPGGPPVVKGAGNGQPFGGPPFDRGSPGRFKKGQPPIQNVFCPTGDGGGVDPSCSPKSESDFEDEVKLPTKVWKSIYSLPADGQFYTIEGIPGAGKAARFPATKIVHEAVYVMLKDYSEKDESDQRSGRFLRRMKIRGFWRPTEQLGERPEPKSTQNIHCDAKPIQNVFCPTGKGGGVDPTCGKFAEGAKSKVTPSGETMHEAVLGLDKVWRNAAGDPAPEHIQKLGIPPAWKNVHVNLDPHGDLLARGTDRKGLSQSKYGDTHTANAAAAKFGRVTELREKRAEIFAELDRDAKDLALRDRAECLKLVMQTGIRPGSDRDWGSEHASFGATTLLGRHVQADGSLKFATGKNKGREVEFPVQDKATAAMLKRRAEAAGPDGRLFNTDAPSLRQYSLGKDGGGYRTKDHRTALGTETAVRAIKERIAPTSAKEYREAVKAVATAVSKTLGNTPAIALKSYIDPSVFQHWRQSSGS